MRGRKITVNAVAPGPTATDLFLEGKSPELIDRMAKMDPLDRLPPAIECFISSTDIGDTNGFIECFTPDAVIVDWGRFESHQGVAPWDKADNAGAQSRIDPIAIKPSKRGYLLTAKVSGNGHNGVGNLYFETSNGKIAALVIE